MDDQCATLLGYTDEELEANFSKTLHRHAEVMGLSYEAYREKLCWWFNGYRFSPDCEDKVYNPYAIGQTLGALKRRFIHRHVEPLRHDLHRHQLLHKQPTRRAGLREC